MTNETDWRWCRDSPQEAAAEIDRLRAAIIKDSNRINVVWTIDTQDACLCKNGKKVMTLGRWMDVPMDDTMDLAKYIAHALNFYDKCGPHAMLRKAQRNALDKLAAEAQAMGDYE